MVQAKALQELKENGVVCGYKLQDENGTVMNIRSEAIVDAMKKNLINITNIIIKDGNKLVMIDDNKDNNKETKNKQVEVENDTREVETPVENSSSEIAHMRELINKINSATKIYEQGKDEIMSNKEWDMLYDELVALEAETGIVLAESPTQEVGYEIVSELPKEHHPSKMLSLEKTKSIDDLKTFLGNKEGVLGWKLDGLTVVLTYKDGNLEKAVTRGNGEIGEVVTPNAKQFKNVPRHIALKGTVILRGEAIIRYSTFERINASITSEDDKYKNPRNLCSGSVRQLDSQITAKRSVEWHCFEIVEASLGNVPNNYDEQMAYVRMLGFDTVETINVTAATIDSAIEKFKDKIVNKYDIPSDGLVLTFRDRAYGKSLGCTTKTPRHSKAFKWQDEEALTTLKYIEWSPSRTGLINPIAVFEPVELEGTTVERASLHNISVMLDILGQPYVGQRIKVYKANMIIPCISWGEKLSE